MSEHPICLCHTEHNKMCISILNLSENYGTYCVILNQVAYTKLDFKRPSHITMILKYLSRQVRLNVSMSLKIMIPLGHGEEHVKKLFSTAVIENEDTHSNLVRGHCFTGEDTNIFHP